MVATLTPDQQLEQLRQLQLKLKPVVGNVVDDQLTMLALETPRGLVTYRDGKFWDCHNHEVECSPADIINVAWMETGETLLKYMDRVGIDIPEDKEPTLTQDTRLEIENHQLREENQELKDQLATMQERLTQQSSAELGHEPGKLDVPPSPADAAATAFGEGGAGQPVPEAGGGAAASAEDAQKAAEPGGETPAT